jgi:hypothetical protein
MESERELHIFPKNTFKKIIEQETINSTVDKLIPMFEKALRVAAKEKDRYEEIGGTFTYNVKLDVNYCIKNGVVNHIKNPEDAMYDLSIYEFSLCGLNIIKILSERFDAEYKGYKKLKVSEGIYVTDSSIVLFISPRNN